MRATVFTLLSFSLIAHEASLQAPLRRVRLYPDQAWMTRETTFHFHSAGAQRLRIKGLPAGLTLEDLPKTKAALDDHWFEPFFAKLQQACADIAADYGKWTDRSAFEALGDVADEIVAHGGVIVSGHKENGGFYVHIPFTPETMPDE